MMHVEHNYHTNTMEPSYLIHSLKHIGNGVPRTGSLQSVLSHYQMELLLQGSDIIVSNDHKPLAKFLNGKNTNNKVNR